MLCFTTITPKKLQRKQESFEVQPFLHTKSHIICDSDLGEEELPDTQTHTKKHIEGERQRV